MATFGKRAQPKHRADPADRRRTSAPAPRSGTHAAPIVPAPPSAPAMQGHAPAATTSTATAPPATTRPATTPPAAAPGLRHTPVPVAQPDARPDDKTAAPDTLKVLVVDDNEDVRGLLRIAFARAEITVVGTASSSREALELAQRNPPDIVLLDVNLPEIAGLDLLPLLREGCPAAKVVMFSAQCSREVTETALQRGAVGFIEKGVSMKSVILHLRQVAAASDDRLVQPFPLRVYG